MASGKKIGILLLSLSVLVLLAGTTACKKDGAEGQETTPEGTGAPGKEFEGIVKTAHGQYLYLPTAQGFDIVLEGFDAASLIDQEIKVTGELLRDKPSIFRADIVETKGASGAYTSVFERTEDLVLADFIDSTTRDAFPALEITGVNDAGQWEGHPQAKVFGKLEIEESEEGAESKAIVITGTNGRVVGRILVDGLTDYAQYYLKKLRLFEEFWFYLNVKETVEGRARTRDRQLFHADIVFAGLY